MLKKVESYDQKIFQNVIEPGYLRAHEQALQWAKKAAQSTYLGILMNFGT